MLEKYLEMLEKSLEQNKKEYKEYLEKATKRATNVYNSLEEMAINATEEEFKKFVGNKNISTTEAMIAIVARGEGVTLKQKEERELKQKVSERRFLAWYCLKF